MLNLMRDIENQNTHECVKIIEEREGHFLVEIKSDMGDTEIRRARLLGTKFSIRSETFIKYWKEV